MQTQLSRRSLEILALALVYFVIGKLGLLLAIPPSYAAPIWPAAGIALAAVLIFGNRIAPGVFLGSFLANLANPYNIADTNLSAHAMLLPLAVAIGPTLQALIGAALIRRFVAYPMPLQGSREIIKFLALGGPASCLISASVSVSILFLTGALPEISYAFSWWTWWVGDTIGVVVMMPLILTWIGEPRELWQSRRKTVAIPLLLAFAVIVGVFAGAREEFLGVRYSVLAWAVLAIGMAFTGLLGAFLLSMSGQAMLLKQLLMVRTAELARMREAEEALRKKDARIRRLVESNIIGVIIWHTNGTITDANDAFLKLSGYSRDDLVSGKIRWDDMTPPEYRAADAHSFEEVRRTGTCIPYEKEYLRKDGKRVPVLIGRAVLEESPEEGVSFVLDLSSSKAAEQQIRHMANHDALTGLPNRVLLQDRLQQAIAYAQRNQSRVAILFIDLDYFKNINDSLGHHIGDLVLQIAASRLQRCLREGDSVARLGGDEFVLCLPFLKDIGDAAQVAEKALIALTQTFVVEAKDLHLSASIGISLYPDDGIEVESLMRAADTAMYHAKEMGRANYKFFTAALNQAAQQRLAVSNRLRGALEKHEFVLHYQPQVTIETGAIYSTEALLRWQPRGKKPVSCGAFIDNAEESGLIVPIGEWVLREACMQLKIWRDAGFPDLKVAVNLSPRQLEQADFCQMVEQILADAGIPATALELEITESSLMRRSDFNLAALNHLSKLGICLSLDDFGTGYSSLGYLQRFPVHALKIDRSFVRDIGQDSNDTALVTAIIAMAASLQLKVIAEGVETSQQAQFLLARGCLAGQGFYYSKAVAPETLLALLKNNSNSFWQAHSVRHM
jgi:diguanylate cyclase (GGDEF)-like protein/PAS domain S-box-containing protein